MDFRQFENKTLALSIFVKLAYSQHEPSPKVGMGGSSEQCGGHDQAEAQTRPGKIWIFSGPRQKIFIARDPEIENI